MSGRSIPRASRRPGRGSGGGETSIAFDKASDTPASQIIEQVKSATTLVELVWLIGKAVQAEYDEQQADRTCSQYRESYGQRYALVKILGMAQPVPLASIYTEVRIVRPTSLRGYRTQEELQDSFLRNGRSLAGYDFNRHQPRSGLEVANNMNHRFLNLLGVRGPVSRPSYATSA